MYEHTTTKYKCSECKQTFPFEEDAANCCPTHFHTIEMITEYNEN